MTLVVKHYASAESTDPIDWDPKTEATVDLATNNKARYPGATKLFDSDVHDTEPVLVCHGENKGDLPPRPTLKELEASATTPGSKLPVSIGDLFLTTKIARHVILQVRRLLPRGALNAVYMLSPEGIKPGQPANYRDPNHPLGYVCGKTSPAFLYQKYTYLQMMSASPGEYWLSPFEQVLAEFYATLHVQAGVCNMISSIVAGVTSMMVTPDGFNSAKPTTLLRVSHVDKHSFCLLSYGNSPWIVLDPWCAEPYACPVEQNAFSKDGIRAYTQFDFYKRFDDPFGIPLMAKWKTNHLASPPVTGLNLTAGLLRSATAAADGITVADEDNMVIDNLDVMVWEGGGWEENRKAFYEGAMGETAFHLSQDAWQEQTNLELTGEAYAKHFKRTAPVVMGHHWGEKDVPSSKGG